MEFMERKYINEMLINCFCDNMTSNSVRCEMSPWLNFKVDISTKTNTMDLWKHMEKKY